MDHLEFKSKLQIKDFVLLLSVRHRRWQSKRLVKDLENASAHPEKTQTYISVFSIEADIRRYVFYFTVLCLLFYRQKIGCLHWFLAKSGLQCSKYFPVEKGHCCVNVTTTTPRPALHYLTSQYPYPPSPTQRQWIVQAGSTQTTALILPVR